VSAQVEVTKSAPQTALNAGPEEAKNQSGARRPPPDSDPVDCGFNADFVRVSPSQATPKLNAGRRLIGPNQVPNI